MTPLPDQMEVRHTLPLIIPITAVLEHDLQLEMHDITIQYWLLADIRIYFGLVDIEYLIVHAHFLYFYLFYRI